MEEVKEKFKNRYMDPRVGFFVLFYHFLRENMDVHCFYIETSKYLNYPARLQPETCLGLFLKFRMKT